MREKFERSSGHINVADINLEHNEKLTQQNLERLKQTVETMKTISDARKEASGEYMNIEDMKVASDEDVSNITMGDVHKHR